MDIPKGIALINFQDFDEDNPPSHGHYITTSDDNKIQIDYFNGFWCGVLLHGYTYKVTGYAKITLLKT